MFYANASLSVSASGLSSEVRKFKEAGSCVQMAKLRLPFAMRTRSPLRSQLLLFPRSMLQIEDMSKQDKIDHVIAPKQGEVNITFR